MTIELLSTKIEIPTPRPSLVARPHLIQRLDEGLAAGNSLFLISAPAGYGKSTLLAQWLRRRGTAQDSAVAQQPAVHAGWLTLDEADNDPVRFLSYLGAALQRADAALAHGFLAALPFADLPSWDSLLPGIVNAIAALTDPVLLVLDDYHHIAAQPVHDVVASLCEFMPTNLHLVIATRADPPLPLARWRGRGQVTELRQHDLRFSVAEANEFLVQVMGLALAPDHVTALAGRTEGWIAGLQMAAVSLQGRSDAAEFIHAFTGSHRHILDYLSEEVYRRQTPTVQRFLVQTSILDRFDAALCSAVTAPDEEQGSTLPVRATLADPAGAAVLEAQRILEHLEHANLFVVPLDDERRWYRYHHLFADLLRQRLDQERPDAAQHLHLRASQWCEQQHLLHDAIRHALIARQYERAAALMERAAETTMMSSEIATLRSWIEALPPATLRVHPLLCVYEAGALLLAGDTSGQVEARLREALLGAGDNTISGSAAVTRALMATYQGQADKSRRLAQRALELLPGHSPFFRSFATLVMALNTMFEADDEVAIQHIGDALTMSDLAGNLMNSVLARCHLAELAILRNHLDEAEQLYRAALALAGSPQSLEPASGLPLMGLGSIAYERNRLANAQDLLEEGITLIAGWGELGALQGRVVLAKVRWAMGDFAGAETMLHLTDEAITHGHLLPEMMRQQVLTSRASTVLRQNDLRAADRYARAAGIHWDDSRVELARPATMSQCYDQLVRAQLLSAHGHQRTALLALTSLQQCAQEQGRERLVLLALIEQALVHHQLGRQAPALEALQAALALAQPAGCVCVFVEPGEPMADLLRLALRHGLCPDFTARLLAAFASAPPTREGDPSLQHAGSGGMTTLPTGVDSDPTAAAPAQLSSRELQVLDLAAKGMTNQEIARHLSVEVSTVKTHVNHICRKLDVANRTGAVARARQLHLLAQQ